MQPIITARNRRIQELYTRDHQQLHAEDLNRMRILARQWDLAPVLQRGGIAVFPHITVQDCGHHVLAAIHAVLSVQASRVLVISVLHAWTPEMDATRNALAAGEDFTGHPLRGIQGPQFGTRTEWRMDHALMSWRYFWRLETQGWRGALPQIIECYPFLAGSDPTTMPGYDEVARLAEDAVIVTTADPFHHGIGYGNPPAQALAAHAGGLELAHASILKANELLAAGDYQAYLRHCVEARNDARDAGPLFHTLRRPAQATIHEVVASDMTELYASPPPTWVAGALVSWE